MPESARASAMTAQKIATSEPQDRLREVAEELSLKLEEVWTESPEAEVREIHAALVRVVEERQKEIDRLVSARAAHNRTADQITHKRCENLEREILEEWMPRTQRAELEAVAAFERGREEGARDERDRCVAAVQTQCGPCGGTGTVAEPGHDCGGDQERCAAVCPIPVPTQCEYCGRAVDAIRARGLEEKP